jgi:hypothetical protein
MAVVICTNCRLILSLEQCFAWEGRRFRVSTAFSMHLLHTLGSLLRSSESKQITLSELHFFAVLLSFRSRLASKCIEFKQQCVGCGENRVFRNRIEGCLHFHSHRKITMDSFQHSVSTAGGWPGNVLTMLVCKLQNVAWFIGTGGND